MEKFNPIGHIEENVPTAENYGNAFVSMLQALDREVETYFKQRELGEGTGFDNLISNSDINPADAGIIQNALESLSESDSDLEKQAKKVLELKLKIIRTLSSN